MSVAPKRADRACSPVCSLCAQEDLTSKGSLQICDWIQLWAQQPAEPRLEQQRLTEQWQLRPGVSERVAQESVLHVLSCCVSASN